MTRLKPCKPVPLPATKANVDEVRHNVIMEIRTMGDLVDCGCPACMVAHGQLVRTKGVRMIDEAIKAYENNEDIELIESMYAVRDLLTGVGSDE